jgi:hypothetical protein
LRSYWYVFSLPPLALIAAHGLATTTPRSNSDVRSTPLTWWWILLIIEATRTRLKGVARRLPSTRDE